MQSLTGLLLQRLMSAAAPAQSLDGQINLIRQINNTDREAVITLNVHFTSVESAAFWPLYREYRAAQAVNGERRVALIKDYAAHYESMTDEKAGQLLDDFLAFEQAFLDTKREYTDRFRRILPHVKVTRIMQIENKVDNAVASRISAEIPLLR